MGITEIQKPDGADRTIPRLRIDFDGISTNYGAVQYIFRHIGTQWLNVPACILREKEHTQQRRGQI